MGTRMPYSFADTNKLSISSCLKIMRGLSGFGLIKSMSIFLKTDFLSIVIFINVLQKIYWCHCRKLFTIDVSTTVQSKRLALRITYRGLTKFKKEGINSDTLRTKNANKKINF